jgi:DNA-binding IclR family transcriptional regulator
LEGLAVLRFLKRNPKAAQEQIAKHFGRSERTIKSMTVRLTEKEYLIRKNGKRDGWWKVLVELPVTPQKSAHPSE